MRLRVVTSDQVRLGVTSEQVRMGVVTCEQVKIIGL